MNYAKTLESILERLEDYENHVDYELEGLTLELEGINDMLTDEIRITVIGTGFDKKARKAIEIILEKYEGMEGAILPVLHEVNSTFSYLPEPALRIVSKEMDIPVSNIFRIATFYNAFSLEQKGKYTISVCMGTACYVKGSQRILDGVARQLSIGVGETSGDGLFTLETVSCLGCCGQAPVLTVNEDLHGHVTQKGLADILKSYS